MMKHLVFLCLIIWNVHTLTTVLEQTCNTLAQAFYHGHSCFIGSNAKATFSQAQANCQLPQPNLPIGHLAFVLTQETLNAMIKAYNEGKLLHDGFNIALEQIPSNDESDGGRKGWTWVHPFLPNRPVPDHDLILWTSVRDPHAWNGPDDVAMLTVPDDGMIDVDPTVANHYLCEHEEPKIRANRRCHTNKIGHNTTFITEYNGLNRIDCARACRNDLMCRSFSFNQVTSHCITQLTDGGMVNFEPIQKNGYDFYVTNYSYNKTLASFPVCTE